MSRADIPEAERRDFRLYVDEFQNFICRQLRVDPLGSPQVSTQSLISRPPVPLAQLDEATANAVWGNVGSIVAFQVGTDDAQTSRSSK